MQSGELPGRVLKVRLNTHEPFGKYWQSLLVQGIYGNLCPAIGWTSD